MDLGCKVVWDENCLGGQIGFGVKKIRGSYCLGWNFFMDDFFPRLARGLFAGGL